MPDEPHVLIAGYLDQYQPPVDPNILLDATAWLDQPAAWPALLWALGGARAAIEAFDVDPADVDVLLDRLGAAERWPVFTINLDNGHGIYLVWRNFEDVSGWDYLLAGRDFADPVALAQLDGHFRGPGMCWAEVVKVANQAPAPLDRARRLLLLLPMLGDADLPIESTNLVSAALAQVGAQRNQDTVAAELLAGSRRFWGNPSWDEHNGFTICLGHHSFRGPSASPHLLRAVSSALGDGH